MTSPTVQTENKLHEMQVMGLLSSITAMAYLKTLEGKAYVFCDYAGETNEIDVTALAINAKETDDPLISEVIYLAPLGAQKDETDAWVEILQELTELQEQIRDL